MVVEVVVEVLVVDELAESADVPRTAEVVVDVLAVLVDVFVEVVVAGVLVSELRWVVEVEEEVEELVEEDLDCLASALPSVVRSALAPVVDDSCESGTARLSRLLVPSETYLGPGREYLRIKRLPENS